MNTDTEQNVTEEAEVEQVEELSEEQVEAEFTAGFTGQPVVEPAAPESNEADNDTQEATGNDDPPAALATLTQSQLDELLEKSSQVDVLRQEINTTRDRLFGKYGEVQRTLSELQKAQEMTPAEEASETLPEQLKRTAEDYPELAEALAEDLSPFIGGIDGHYVDEKMKAQAENLSDDFDQKLEYRMLKFMRPNWEQEKSTPEFAEFKSQMSPETLDSYETSLSADVVNGHFKAFDEWKEAKTKQASDALAQKKSEKEQRLATAINPRGGQTDHSVSPEDEFAAGFKAARGL